MLALTEIPTRKPLALPDIWGSNKPPERLSTTEKVDAVIVDFVSKVTPALSTAIDRGMGREAVGAVLGREDEDTEIGIDGAAERFERRILTQCAKKYDLPLFVFSEHDHFGVGGSPEVIGALDPIDNSGEYQAGLNTPPYVAIGFFDMDGTPIAGTSINLLTRHIFINRRGKNYEYNSRTRQLTELPIPTRIESITDARFTPVSYDGKYKYTRPFRLNFDRLDRDRNQSSVFHGKAGAHQYGEGVARGAISAYIMFGEPISEVVQGMAFLRDAGYIAASINPHDGTWEEYRFDPEFYLKNLERYNTDRIPLFVVASSRPLLYEIIRYGFTKPLPGFDRLI